MPFLFLSDVLAGWTDPALEIGKAVEPFPILTHTTGVLPVMLSNSMSLKFSSFAMRMCSCCRVWAHITSSVARGNVASST